MKTRILSMLGVAVLLGSFTTAISAKAAVEIPAEYKGLEVVHADEIVPFWEPECGSPDGYHHIDYSVPPKVVVDDTVYPLYRCVYCKNYCIPG